MKRAFFRICLALAALLVFVAMGTFIPRPLWPQSPSGEPATQRIVLLRNPIHTDIAIPLDDRSLASFSAIVGSGIQADLPGARYLVFGWGSREFYIETPTWSELKPGPLFAALTADESVMHVDVMGEIDLAHPTVQLFEIEDQAMYRLQDFIAASFRSGPEGPIRLSDAGYGDLDAFFEANGHFNALVGCNTWTAQALRVAGLRTGWWNPLPQSLGVSLALYNRAYLGTGGSQP